MRKTSKHVGLYILLTGWTFVISAGAFLLNQYAFQPGKQEHTLNDWPQGARLVHLSPDRPTFVLFLHPKCPCSQASIHELKKLQAQIQSQVKTYVVFYQPETWALSEVQGELWRLAHQIPGVEILIDHAAEEAVKFGTQTSGQGFMFAPSGKNIFNGGITLARGEVGDSPGRKFIVSYLKEKATESKGDFPVFGCSLFNQDKVKGNAI